ncbi:hypothetical protein J5Y09_07260 [Roseomonas sp. PWR1]|uniref:Uncharacterized protein n=1 Tax=Roseomonas nitratireducens TaxID=2820810 RepID=A0ABS4AQQ0_9PROT|nr:hypothetical protein [Neoroseomonas nitratireducens]MBP0463704.1 hypothetical protein [Neoroseomonas nitratireducens]
MPSAPSHSPELAIVLDVFPDEAPLVRRLFLADPAFRSACEDYRLARDGLESFERLRREGPRPEVEDYQRVVRELESEMRGMIRSARGRT